MTPEEIERLRGLCEKAQPAPWNRVTSLPHSRFMIGYVREPYRGGYYGVATASTNDDAQFIAAAREAIPRLLDEVERLRKRLHSLYAADARAEADAYADAIAKSIARAEKAEAEVERLREVDRHVAGLNKWWTRGDAK